MKGQSESNFMFLHDNAVLGQASLGIQSIDRRRTRSLCGGGACCDRNFVRLHQPFPMRSSSAPLPTPYCLVTLGASTGGPQAIATFLSALPPDFPAALVIVQHGSAHFSRRLVPWFQTYSALRVRVVEVGMKPVPGEVWVAATDHHVVLRANQTLVYLDRSPGRHYSPSLDLWFESLAQHWSAPGIAILLTGMGRDGALGLKKLRDRRWYTFAQDESSSSIHSMPKAAIELGAAHQVLSPEKIAAMCVRLCVQGVG